MCPTIGPSKTLTSRRDHHGHNGERQRADTYVWVKRVFHPVRLGEASSGGGSADGGYVETAVTQTTHVDFDLLGQDGAG